MFSFPPNEIKLTAVLWKHDAKMSSCFNCLINPFHTAVSYIRITIWLLALLLESVSPKTMFNEDLLHPFWKTKVSWVICRIIHFLWDCYPRSIDILSISKPGLNTPWSKIHVASEQGIIRINSMTLWVVNHNESLISWTVSLLNSGIIFSLSCILLRN